MNQLIVHQPLQVQISGKMSTNFTSIQGAYLHKFVRTISLEDHRRNGGMNSHYINVELIHTYILALLSPVHSECILDRMYVRTKQ